MVFDQKLRKFKVNEAATSKPFTGHCFGFDFDVSKRFNFDRLSNPDFIFGFEAASNPAGFETHPGICNDAVSLYHGMIT